MFLIFNCLFLETTAKTAFSNLRPRSMATLSFTFVAPRIVLTNDPSEVVHRDASNNFEAVTRPYLISRHNGDDACSSVSEARLAQSELLILCEQCEINASASLESG
uniref:Uncharacterized protein n=1 Tax=Cacopsylla melanoneura TaxID=428564 RepID=A0A8D9E430_9HEMI